MQAAKGNLGLGLGLGLAIRKDVLDYPAGHAILPVFGTGGTGDIERKLSTVAMITAIEW